MQATSCMVVDSAHLVVMNSIPGPASMSDPKMAVTAVEQILVTSSSSGIGSPVPDRATLVSRSNRDPNDEITLLTMILIGGREIAERIGVA